jgi:hypothetical protein
MPWEGGGSTRGITYVGRTLGGRPDVRRTPGQDVCLGRTSRRYLYKGALGRPARRHVLESRTRLYRGMC